MNRPQSARTRPPPPCYTTSHDQNPSVYDADEDDGVLNDDDHADLDDQNDDDEIDLDAYEAYLAEIQKKAESRPQSNARPLRPYPSESPQFYMVNAMNPVTPIDLRSISSPSMVESVEKPRVSASRPTVRPMSARPRMNSGGEDGQSISRSSAQVPRAPQTARPSSASSGARHRRNENITTSGGGGGGGSARGGRGDTAVSARIRAVYSDVGRASSSSSSSSRVPTPTTSSSSHTATSVLQSRLKVFQEAELQHEYSRLVDVVSDLRCVVQHEQSQRLKAMARVRRLEEIVALKDKKIEAMLQSQSTSASLACHGMDPTALSALAQREMAQKERHHHALMQKLRHKLAQQSQILASYEDAMHTLRSSIKCTQRMELEEETQQLRIEVTRLHSVVEELQSQADSQRRQLSDVASWDAQHNAHVSKLQQQLQRSAKEKHVLEQELLFLRATVHKLEHALGLEQKKRVYDHAMASSSSRSGGGRTPTRTSASSPHSTARTMSSPRVDSAAASSLAEALAEMKTLRGAAADDLSASSAASPVKRQRPTAAPIRVVTTNGEEEEDDEGGIGPHLHSSAVPTAPPLVRRMSSSEMVGEQDVVISEKRAREGGAHACEGRGLVGVLKSPLSGEAEGTKKHVRWRTTEEEEEEEAEQEEDSEQHSVIQSSGSTSDIEQERKTNEIEVEEEEEEAEEEEEKAEAEDKENVETREKTPLDQQDDSQAERTEERVDDVEGNVTQRNEVELEDEEAEEEEEEEKEEEKEVNQSISQSQALGVDGEGDNEAAENDHVYRHIPSVREDPERQDLGSESSLSRTNSSESRSSDSTSLGSLSRSDSSASSSNGSTQLSGSSSLSSLLAQADAATMALETAVNSEETEETEELQYASDFSDGAE